MKTALFCLTALIVSISSGWAAEAGTEEAQALSLEKETSQKSESEIPLQLQVPQKRDDSQNSQARLIFSFGLMAFILGVGFYLAKKHGRRGNTKQTQIKLLTQYHLGPKKSLAIVRVAGESILIGITDHQVNLIKSLALLDDEVPENLPSASFEKTLNEKKEFTFAEPPSSPAVPAPTLGEEFSIRHIKDVVSLKLKGMRSEA